MDEQKSRRVWTNFGICNALARDLAALDWLSMQMTNKFFYSVAVSRS